MARDPEAIHGACSFGCWKEAVGCDKEIKRESSTPFYAIACLPRYQICHCSWQNDFGQGFPLAIRVLGFIIVIAISSLPWLRIPPSPPVDFARNIGLNDPDRYRYAREKTQLRLLGRSLFELGQSSEYHSPRLRRILSCIGWFTDTFGLVRII